jgi:hypothetical protein
MLLPKTAANLLSRAFPQLAIRLPIEYPDPSQDSGSLVLVNQKGDQTVLADKWTDLTGLAWSPNGKEIWFTGTPTSSEGALYAVSLDGRLRLMLTVPADLQMMDVAGDGRVLLGSLHWRAEMYGAFSGDKTSAILVDSTSRYPPIFLQTTGLFSITRQVRAVGKTIPAICKRWMVLHR